jgi:hypothetical protein
MKQLVTLLLAALLSGAMWGQVSPPTNLMPVPTLANDYCNANGTWIGSISDGGAALPIRCINTSIANTPSNGAHTSVPVGANLTTYLAAAKCGDVLLLTPGQYSPFTLPAKKCDAAHWITIMSSAIGLPNVTTRITPCLAGLASLAGRPVYACPTPQNLMATFTAPNSAPVINADSGASYYKIGPGVAITRSDAFKISYGLVVLKGSDHIIFDRVWAHGTEATLETKYGFSLDGATNIAIINSYLNDFKCIAGVGGACTDAQAINGGDDPAGLPEGTWKIFNNFIEASGENIMFGGGNIGTTTPSDVEIRLNHFYKVPAWFTKNSGYVQPYAGFNGYIVKNIVEFKNAQRVLLEGNRMEYSWGGYSQNGSSVLFTPRGTWGHVIDITVRYNYISHVGSGFQIVATSSGSGAGAPDSGGAARISIHDTLTDDVNATYYRGEGSMAEIGSSLRINTPLNNVVLNHNTFVTDGTEGTILILGTIQTNPQPRMGPLTFTNNIVRAGQYDGIWQLGAPFACATDQDPIDTFARCFTQTNVTGNLIVGWRMIRATSVWPTGNKTPATYTTVFVNPLLSGGDYRVLSPYQKAGTDGKDIGADITNLLQVMASAN